MLQIQRSLIRSQELGDEKLQILQHMQDIIENKARQLDQDYKNLDLGHDNENHDNNKHDNHVERATKRSRRQRTHELGIRNEGALHEKIEKDVFSSGGAGGKRQKKKKRKSKAEKEQDTSPVEPPIDPDEPTYCLCEQVSFGEMICCDNEECSIEWFHFQCVGLTTKPKGKWYCPKCRGDRSNQMKPKVS